MTTTRNNVLDRERKLDDLTARRLADYEGSLKAKLEEEHLGAVVAIQSGSCEYTVGNDSNDAIRAIRSRNMEGLLFVRRIGNPKEEDDRFAAGVAAAEAKNKRLSASCARVLLQSPLQLAANANRWTSNSLLTRVTQAICRYQLGS